MALGKCPECDGIVSTTASACPHCGNTNFSVPTGKWAAQKCSDCNGSGRCGPVDETILCGLCLGTGQRRLSEMKDLRDGSLREAYIG